MDYTNLLVKLGKVTSSSGFLKVFTVFVFPVYTCNWKACLLVNPVYFMLSFEVWPCFFTIQVLLHFSVDLWKMGNCFMLC